MSNKFGWHPGLPDGLQFSGTIFFVIQPNATLSSNGDLFFGFDTPAWQDVIKQGLASATTGNLTSKGFGASLTGVYILDPRHGETEMQRGFFAGPGLAATVTPSLGLPVGPVTGAGYSNGTFGVVSGLGTSGVSVGGSYAQHVATFPSLRWSTERFPLRRR